MSGFVYFAEKDGEIKIGWSTDPVRRVASLKSTMLGVIRTDRSSEKLLHAGFASTRLAGEWFSPSEELKSLIGKSEKLNRPLTMYARIPKSLYRKIHMIAKKETRTVSNVIFMALQSYLKEKQA